ncbi:TfoX/Sxy family protein [Phaeocystidibacter luteus]|uniref:TfoX/Sxy family protein n=1 Tax=Phaeocystidibacter luteus TaxID=911197 RepID=A0A6N6RES2_9FLAO|nr:TfoX/Sxy family protein [Phaeocystidibacter luteus]KAB2808697.1 TfoX/Sxy family protein [Phaeocystidibacter luteus]
MAYDTFLSDRIERALKETGTNYATKHMFGGLAFMVDDKMCCGIVRDDLMARVGPDRQAEALEQTGARPMEFTGRPMKGYVFVDSEGLDTDADLMKWIKWCLEFNPHAKSSKKKK